MKQVKCPNCKREFELNENIVVYMCPCGELMDFKEEQK